MLSNVKLCRQRHFVLSAAEIYLNLFFIPPDIVSFSFHVAKEKEPARRNFNSAPFLRILSDSCEIVWIFILVSTEKLLRSTCIVCSTRANPGDALVLKQKYNPEKWQYWNFSTGAKIVGDNSKFYFPPLETSG